MNCHLSGGQAHCMKRFNEIRTIYYSQIGQKQENSIPTHDAKFLFGDLNFRLQLDKDTSAFYAKKRNFAEMLKQDQFWNQFNQFNFLPSLEESRIAFPPTYKFVKGGSNYDLDRKPPSW